MSIASVRLEVRYACALMKPWVRLRIRDRVSELVLQAATHVDSAAVAGRVGT